MLIITYFNNCIGQFTFSAFDDNEWYNYLQIHVN